MHWICAALNGRISFAACYIRWDFSSALAAVLLSLSEKPKRDFTRSDERHFNFLVLCSVPSYLSLSLCFSLYPLNLTESLIILNVFCYLFPPWCSTSKTIRGQKLPFVHLNLFVICSFATKTKVHFENDLFVRNIHYICKLYNILDAFKYKGSVLFIADLTCMPK